MDLFILRKVYRAFIFFHPPSAWHLLSLMYLHVLPLFDMEQLLLNIRGLEHLGRGLAVVLED